MAVGLGHDYVSTSRGDRDELTVRVVRPQLDINALDAQLAIPSVLNQVPIAIVINRTSNRDRKGRLFNVGKTAGGSIGSATFAV